MKTRFTGLVFLALLLVVCLGSSQGAEEKGELRHGYVDSGGVKIHYVTAGKGPLVVMIHGFPDYWYTWRKQIPSLARNYQVVAIDQRGYNRSDQPSRLEDYKLDKLTGDIAAVLKHFKRPSATIVGHDWGGMVAWTFAMQQPKQVDRLIILNLPHPKGLMRELANNPEQQKNSQYARNFQIPGAEMLLRPELLAAWVKAPEARKRYVEAFRRSSIKGMLNYYRANYPKPPYTKEQAEEQVFPKVQCPVLMIHGLKDKALLPGALNDTWKWLERPLTLVTVPGADHFVQQDAADFVTKTIVSWMRLRDELKHSAKQNAGKTKKRSEN